jgi:Amt family ammonium transporter
VLSAATPRTHESRIATSGLIALALSSLLFATLGFGLMLGGVGTVSPLPELSAYVTYYSLPVSGQAWGLFGLRGFMLDGVNNTVLLDLFASYMPLVALCAMLTASLLARRSGYGVQLVVISVISGLIFPIAGFWLWGGGWLGMLGANLNLGHGAVDMGGLATAALVVGAAGIGWVMLFPRQPASENPELPPTHFPFRAMAGMVCVIIGAAAQLAGNPLHGNNMERFASALLLNLVMAGGLAALVALGYTVFISHQPNPLLAARAVIAAVITVSVGGILLPVWSTALVGILCGLIAPLGLYVTNEVLGWQDDGGIISMTLLPALLGFLLTGLLATGGIGVGWNGVGAVNYLGIEGLGIVGALPLYGLPADPGQFSAQLVAVIAVGIFAWLAFMPFALALSRVKLTLPRMVSSDHPATLRATDTPTTSQQASEPMLTVNVDSLPVETAPAYIVTAINNEQPTFTRPIESVNVERAATTEAASPTNVAETAEAAPQVPTPAAPTVTQTAVAPPPQPPKESLLQWLRRGRAPKQTSEKPVQARHVAYPIRVGGRRIPIRITPVRDNAAPSASPSPAADGGEAAS